MAMHYNRAYWSGVIFQIEGKGSFNESDRSRKARISIEAAFRESAWRLLLREHDREQRKRIESLARSFDDDFEDALDHDVKAHDYGRIEKELSENIEIIIDRMQKLHKLSYPSRFFYSLWYGE